MKFILLIISSGFFSLMGFSQAPTIQWQKGLIGTATDVAVAIRQTNDGGYISVGYTYSSDLDFTGNHGAGDGWVSKLDVNGNIEWKKVLGGSSLDNLSSVIQVSDGGYVVVGRIYSHDGDVSGFHINPADPNTTDGWVIKLNSSGAIQWQKAIGGSGYDYAQCVLETPNGFIIAGNTSSNDGDVSASHAYGGDTLDYWVVNMDMNGNILWEKSYGGSNDERVRAITKTIDGGFAITGTSKSGDGDVSQHLGASYQFNYWTIKINATGILKWNTSFLAANFLFQSSIMQTSDKGFIIAGTVLNYTPQMNNPIIIKTDSTGFFKWQRICENTPNNQRTYINSIVEDSNGDYIACGSTHTYSGNIIPGSGGVMDHAYDDDNAWVMKIDSSANGTVIWKKTYGGSRDETLNDIQRTSDNSFIAAGSASSTDLDVTTNGTDTTLNVWIVKFKPSTIGIKEETMANSLSIYPNPATTMVTILLRNHTEMVSYNILNSIGQIVLSGKLVNETTKLNMETLASGIYLLQINGNASQSVKLVKN